MNKPKNSLRKKIIKYYNKLIWIVKLCNRNPLIFLPDKIYLKRQYRKRMGLKLNLKNPQLFSEKIQWMKLYDRKPEYTHFADKYEVRKYIAEIAGEECLIPSYGIWDYFEDIDFDALPDQFVLKCTHDCGSVLICKDKKELNIPQLQKFFRKRLAANYFWKKREWIYKNIKPRIIAEKLMVDESGIELKDYKIYCFNGKAKVINVVFNRFANDGNDTKENFYSPDWEYLNIASRDRQTDPNINLEKPKCLEKMLSLAEKLSVGIIHMRVDFYIVFDQIFFGELTFCTCAGYERFTPPEWDKILGDWMILPK